LDELNAANSSVALPPSAATVRSPSRRIGTGRRLVHNQVIAGSIWQHCPVANEETEGWFTDPFGRHEARWMSGDTPTDLVRDGRAEGHDPVLDEFFLAKPRRVKYVEHGHASDHFLKSKEGVAVPGGFVTIEPHLTNDGDVPRAKVLLQSTTAIGAVSAKRDIVVWDESREHQLYRDGPYDAITVNRPLERVIAELNRVGVQEFVSRRGGGESRTISITQVTTGQIYERAALTGVEYYWERITAIFRRKR
jgi:hypothetical protein